MNLIAQRMMTGLAALFASVLITACGAHSTNQSTETFTVYEDAPKMSLLDLGAPSNPEFDAGEPVVRPVLGGTGKYMGARGQVTSTARDADGSYTQVFRLLKCRNRIQRCLEQCRVDAIAVLMELENEPNCLGSRFPVRRHISFILS